MMTPDEIRAKADQHGARSVLPADALAKASVTARPALPIRKPGKRP